MLPEINLDNESFDEIMANAKNIIAEVYPEWTDFNYHDPGITILELLAWIKESRQYFLNKISPENVLKYLKLLGIERRRKRPAYSDVCVLCGEDIIIQKGAVFFAGELCFEAEQRTFIPSARIVCLAADKAGGGHVVRADDFGGSMRICPFDVCEPEKSAFYIGFDKALPTGVRCGFFVTVEDNPIAPRNSVTDPGSFIPLADMRTEYFDGTEWRTARITEDKTYAFLFSGELAVTIPGEMHRTVYAGTDAYYLRFVIIGGEYDTAPIITDIEFNTVRLRQRRTLSECNDFKTAEEYVISSELAAAGKAKIFAFSGGLFEAANTYECRTAEDGSVIYSNITADGNGMVRIVNYSSDFYEKSVIANGTGLPFQEYYLGSSDLEYEKLRIMVQIPETGGRYAEWIKVSDFSASGAEDRHFVFDSKNGIVRFGDCVRGAAPEGEILIIGCALTNGALGNAAANKINRMSVPPECGVTVTNKRPAFGGEDEERLEECRGRVHEILSSAETIVSDEDCERRILKTQGLKLESCRVIHPRSGEKNSELVISAVVKPYADDGRGVLTRRYAENILRQTERYRMLGTEINIISPQYADIAIYADIDVPFQSSDARGKIESIVKGYFEGLRGSFGAVVSYSAVYRLLDSLECVACVNALTTDVIGGGVKKTNEGDLVLAPNMTALLSETEYVLHTI